MKLFAFVLFEIKISSRQNKADLQKNRFENCINLGLNLDKPKDIGPPKSA